MDQEELLFKLKKIQIDKEKIVLDQNIFSGLGSREEIDQRFSFYRRKFNQNLEKNTQLYEKARLKLNFMTIPQFTNRQKETQILQISQKSSNFNIDCYTDRPLSSTTSRINGKQFFKSNNQSIASLKTNATLRHYSPGAASSKSSRVNSRHLRLINQCDKLPQNNNCNTFITKPSIRRPMSSISVHQQNNNIIDLDHHQIEKDLSMSPLYSNISSFANILLQVVNSSEKQNIYLIKQACDDFGINCDELQKIENIEDKENYVISCMRGSVIQNLSNWKEKYQQKEVVNELTEKHQLKSLENQNAAKDVFNWLQIKTNFQSLKKKVRLEIIEVFNNQENMKKAETHLKGKKILEGHKKANSNIINNSSNNSEISSKVNQTPNLNKQDSNVNFQVNQYEGNREKAIILENMKSTHQGLSNKQKKKLIDILQSTMLNDEEELKLKLSWDQEKEEEFKENRKKAIKLLYNSIHSSSWNNIASVPIMREKNVTDRGYQYRQELINKFMDNEVLTDKEVKFLANTSELLNSHIDKKHLQQCSNLLSPQIIENIELQIAEKIIEKYFVALNIVKSERHAFLQNKVKEERKKQAQEQEKLSKQAGQSISPQQYRKSYRFTPQQMIKMREKIYRIFCKLQYDVNYQQKQLLKKRNLSCSTIQSPNIQKTEAQKNKEEFLKRNQLNKNQSSKSLFFQKDKELNTQQVQRLFHPPSKVMIGLKKLNNFVVQQSGPQSPKKQQNHQKQQNYEQNKFVKQLLHQKEIQQQYKLNVNRYMQSNQQKGFQSYYTQGPVNTRNYKSKDLHKNEDWWMEAQDIHTYQQESGQWITQEIEKQAAIKIQKVIRRFIEVKKEKYRKQKLQENFLKQIKEKEQQQLQLQYQQSLINIQPSQSTPNLQTYQQQQQLQQQTVTFQEQKQNSEQIANQNVKLSTKKHLVTDLNTNITLDNVAGNNSMNVTSPNSLINANFNLVSNNNFTNINNSSNNNNINTQQQDSINVSNLFAAQQVNDIKKDQSNTQQKTQNETMQTLQNDKAINNIEGNSTKNLLLSCVFGEIPKKIKLQLKQRKLFQAAKGGNLFMAQNSGFVYSAKDVNCYDEQGFTPILYATQKADRSFVKFLIQLGADVNMPSNEGVTPLHLAFQSGDEALILLIIQNKGDLNRITRRGETPIAFGNIYVLEKLGLQEAVAYVNIKDEHQSFFDNNEYYKQQFQKINKQKKKDQNLQIHHLDFQFNYIQDQDESIRGYNEFGLIPELKTFMTPQNKLDIDNKKQIYQQILQAKKEQQEIKNKENQIKRNKL